MSTEQEKTIDDHWSRQYQQKRTRTRWWDSPQIIRHINKTICGEALDGWNAGPIKLLVQVLPDGYVLEKALSDRITFIHGDFSNPLSAIKNTIWYFGTIVCITCPMPRKPYRYRTKSSTKVESFSAMTL